MAVPVTIPVTHTCLKARLGHLLVGQPHPRPLAEVRDTRGDIVRYNSVLDSVQIERMKPQGALDQLHAAWCPIWNREVVRDNTCSAV